jgi:hypothetical protein
MALTAAFLVDVARQGFVWLLLLLLGPAPIAAAGPPQAPSEGTPAPQEAGFQEASARVAPFLFHAGPGIPPVEIPRSERLVYDAYLDIALVSSRVGTVTQTCTVEELEAPILLARADAPSGERASIRLDAEGSYLWYELESTLQTSVLPQPWPRLFYQQSSQSSRGTRRREVLLGTRDDAPRASYRGDTSKGAPEGTRIWRTAQERDVPEGTLDMLTAVFMARSLVREGQKSLTFPLIDGTRLWQLVLRRGKEKRMETGAGEFDVVEVVLEPSPYPGESFGEKARRFEGVFGIQGSMHLWVERRTGIPVRIQGDLPINDGMFVLGVDVVLRAYSGTPEGFAPVRGS